MVNFIQAATQTVGKLLGTAATGTTNTDLPNPQRNVPANVAEQQIKQEISFATRRDSVINDWVNTYSLKAAGIGYVSTPYAGLWERIWGLTPIEDLPKFDALRSFNPFIAASLNIRVNLAIGNWFELQGGSNVYREYLEDWLESHNVPTVARLQESDAITFGFSTTEICRDEDNQRVEWLKPLDPLYMRVRRDAYGDVFGYLQLMSMPPVAFEPNQILKTVNNPGSNRYSSAYGTSELRPVLYTQALIDDFQHDMAMIMKTYTKPILDHTCGYNPLEVPGVEPWDEQKLQNYANNQGARVQGTDMVHGPDVKVTPIQSMTSQVRVDWWLKYLLEQRNAQLGVPLIFLGIPEGTNRSTSETVMQEFVTRLRLRQKLNKYTYETELFPAILAGDFPDSLITPDKVPKAIWRPMWEPSAEVLTDQQIRLFDAALAGDKEVRVKLGMPEEVYGDLKTMRDNYNREMPKDAISQTDKQQDDDEGDVKYVVQPIRKKKPNSSS